MIIAPLERSEMEARHQRARLRRRPAGSAATTPRSRNVQSVLSLGSMEWFHFRGRAYGVPPLPWKAGERLLEAHLTALERVSLLADEPFNREARAEYYVALRTITRLLWENCQPTGLLFRNLKRTPWLRYLLRNPFASASDAEILEHADFFLARRMKSGAQLRPVPASPGRRTSSTT